MSGRQHRAVFYSCHHMDTVLCDTESAWHELIRLATAALCPLCELARLAEHALHHNHPHNRVTGGVIARFGDCMLPLAPGNSPQFQVTVEPAGAVTLAAQASFSSSDPVNAPWTANPDDSTGTIGTLAIGENAPTEAIMLTWVYTNEDGTTATVTAEVDITAGTVASVDITGGTINQIV